VQKVGGMLLAFFESLEFTQSWFTTSVPEPSRVLLLSAFLLLSLRRAGRPWRR
jgi:hypothetical protein